MHSTVRRSASAFWFALVCVLFSGAAFAQTTSVRGTAIDQQGKPIAGATITLTDPAKNQVRKSTTNQDGGFSFPLVGEVNAVGKTVEELRRELVQALTRIIPDVVVTVAVLEIKGNKVYVIGQVNKPGEFIVNPRVDVIQALSLAGGVTAFASPSEIFVLRRDNGQQRRLPFNYDAVLRGRDLEQNVLLRSGDVVVVP